MNFILIISNFYKTKIIREETSLISSILNYRDLTIPVEGLIPILVMILTNDRFHRSTRVNLCENNWSISRQIPINLRWL